MTKIIIVSHGSMAEGVLSAIKMIIGNTENIKAYGLDRYDSPKLISDLIEEDIKGNPEIIYTIFCDIQGGSVHNEMIKLCKYSNIYVVGGLTLSMILEYEINCNDENPRACIGQVVENAKQNISIMSHEEALEKIKQEGGDGTLW